MALKHLLVALRGAQEALDLLHESGVDVDRLIGISNAQGPQARVIRGVMAAIAGDPTHSPDSLHEVNLSKEIKALKPKSPLPKRRKARTSKKTNVEK